MRRRMQNDLTGAGVAYLVFSGFAAMFVAMDQISYLVDGRREMLIGTALGLGLVWWTPGRVILFSRLGLIQSRWAPRFRNYERELAAEIRELRDLRLMVLAAAGVWTASAAVAWLADARLSDPPRYELIVAGGLTTVCFTRAVQYFQVARAIAREAGVTNPIT